MLKLKQRAKSRVVNFIRNNVRFEEAYSPPLYGDSYWYAGPNLWEPPVLIALKDLCRPGMTVFDVGGNMGGLTSAMSRLVGPKGTVCAFEASPRIIGFLQQNVAKQGHHNVTVYHRAVYARSGEIITIYDGDHLNDSIYAKNSASKNGRPVKTLALDDFCDATGLFPDLVKMDIEGAEFDALNGAERLIEKHRPHLLLEEDSADSRCLDFLKERGYIAIDLSNYRQIGSTADYTPGARTRNLLYVHQQRKSALPYPLPVTTVKVQSLTAADFVPNRMNGCTSSAFRLEAGRYLMDVRFKATGTQNSLMCGVRGDGNEIFRYHGYSSLLCTDYYDWVVDVPRALSASVFFEFQNGTSDPSFALQTLEIRKLTGITPSLWPSLVME